MRTACNFAEAYAAATGHSASPPTVRPLCDGPLLATYVEVVPGASGHFGFFRLCTAHAEQLKALGRLRHAALLVRLSGEGGRRPETWAEAP